MSDSTGLNRPVSAFSSVPWTADLYFAAIDLTRSPGDRDVRVSAAGLAAGVLASPLTTGIAGTSRAASVALPAGGTTQASALAIKAQVTIVTVCPAGAAAVLPAAGNGIVIMNETTNVATIFPAPGMGIDANAINVAVGIAPGGVAVFDCVSSIKVVSR